MSTILSKKLIKTYGNDDTDFAFRLKYLRGLNEKIMDLDTVYHNPHNDLSRKINMSNIYNTNVEIMKHKLIMEKLPLWDRNYKLQSYKINKINNFYYICNRIKTENEYNFPNDLSSKCEIEALKIVYSWYKNDNEQNVTNIKKFLSRIN